MLAAEGSERPHGRVRPPMRAVAGLILLSGLVLGGCGPVETAESSRFEKEHQKSPVTRSQAEAAFRQTLAHEKHPRDPEVVCHYEEGEWHCTADGVVGSGETKECVVLMGTVSRKGEIVTTSSDGGAGALPYCTHYLPRAEGE